MIDAAHVSKRYGDTLAVDDLSFTVKAGQVIGFLGPNDSRNSTTIRMVVGLASPSAGTVTVSGSSYGSMRFPLSEVGALLDVNTLHPGGTAHNQVVWLAHSNAISRSRVAAMLSTVELTEVSHRRVRDLGMKQRLGIVAALIGDPRILLFDEPTNGLDPEGILWVRHLLRSLATEDRTVLVSSHLMSERALNADHLIVIGRGRLLAADSVADLMERSSEHHVHVSTPDAAALTAALQDKGATVTSDNHHDLSVTRMECRDVGVIAAAEGLILHELYTRRTSLEGAFFELNHRHADYRAATAAPEQR